MVRDTGTIWVSAAITDDDRAAAREGLSEGGGFALVSLDIDPHTYQQAYDVVSNTTLWFLHHGLFDLSRQPSFDREWREAWQAYRQVNALFAEAVVNSAPDGATVLVQDYHLALLGRMVADQRPDLRCVHFTHIPFCDPEAFRIVPPDVATELLDGMAGYRACGFHSSRWAAHFVACCQAVIGSAPLVFTAPIAPDPAELAAMAATADCAREVAWIAEAVGDRQLIVRVERIEPSKNLLRGLAAFDELLELRPELRGRVTLAAFAYPSRQSLAGYRTYRRDAEALAAAINDRWSAPGWQPVLLDTSDNYPRSIAALVSYDVLLVNPVRDGLNLVAKEGPLVNRKDGVLVLSSEAGAAEELRGTALEVNPFDVSGTAAALGAALDMTSSERVTKASALRSAIRANTPNHWLAAQLRAAQ